MKNQQKLTIVTVKNKNIFDVIQDRISCGHTGSTVIVPHVCNNINAFGAGFAGQIASRFPIVKDNFHLLGKKAKLGSTQFVVAKQNKEYQHSIIFANMISQNGLISSLNPRPLNYAALIYSMNEINGYIKNLKSTTETMNVEIHCPKFGSGLAGGEWNFIENLITDIWKNLLIFIYKI